jgi:transposase-like protein
MAKVITKAVKAAAIKEYVHNNKNLREVATMYGINPETLRRILGNKVRPRGTRYLSDGSVKTPASINGRKVRTSKTSAATPNSNQRWTATEDEMLRDAVLSKMTVKETVELLGRTAPAIYCRKCQLIDEGFISDPETRFVLSTGIKRVRKPMAHVLSTPEVIEGVVEDQVDDHVEEVKDTPAPMSAPASVNSSIELIQLAQIVKDYGVNITVSVTSAGTEVKMSK